MQAWQAYLQNQEVQIAKGQASNKKFKKFFKITIPIAIIEILALIGLVVYLIVLPKNVCRVNVDYKNAVVTINDKETEKLRLSPPANQQEYNFYEFDVYLEIEEQGTFSVTYVVKCDDYKVKPLTDIKKVNGAYTITIQGNKKEKLLTGIMIESKEKIGKFKVNVDVSVVKL